MDPKFTKSTEQHEERERYINEMRLTSQLPSNPLPSTPVSNEPQNALQNTSPLQFYKNASSNLYSIAGFSLINTLISFFNGGVHFVIGLGITQFIDAFMMVIGKEVPAWKTGVLLFGSILDILIIGIIAVLGLLASKGNTWPIVVGAILYGLDALLVLLFKDWIGFFFHGYFLFQIWTNLRFIRLKQKT